ncbi:unnamed protein product [Calicophoron daubneyi]|uniref:Uncharacterized protein n=1 Tax=Calicophoron daubneyi TaxID=300641 RepID=A0AAV2TRV6_CALDB
MRIHHSLTSPSPTNLPYFGDSMPFASSRSLPLRPPLSRSYALRRMIGPLDSPLTSPAALRGGRESRYYLPFNIFLIFHVCFHRVTHVKHTFPSVLTGLGNYGETVKKDNRRGTRKLVSTATVTFFPILSMATHDNSLHSLSSYPTLFECEYVGHTSRHGQTRA